ncbi:MFS transporter (plasmid) [Ensifer adhaerens]|uniref:MFS transporter n=1 Tax=Ensifer adhaerens TaxID=106592 RepID=UPI003CED7A60
MTPPASDLIEEKWRCQGPLSADGRGCQKVDQPLGSEQQGGTFAALKHPNFRLMWLGNLISNSGDWLDQVALNWLVISTTGSPIFLGLVNLARGMPNAVLALVAGVVADKFDRRKMMMVTQTLAMIFAVALFVLVFSGNDSILAILLLATARGVVIAFNINARHFLISELVPTRDLASAIALNSIALNISKILGPLAAAGIIAGFGTATCFLVNAVSFTFVLAMLFLVKLPPKPIREARRERFFTTLLGGITYLRQNDTLLLLVLVALVPTFFAQPYIQLLALFAHDVFHVGSAGLGIMVSVAAGGAIAGGLLSAWLQRDARRGDIMLLFMAGFGAFLLMFSLAPNIYVALPMLFCTGAMHIAYNSSNNTILQISVDDNYRGRVLSTLFMTRGLVSLGTAAIATVAAFLGPRTAMALTTSVVMAFAIVLWVQAPRLRNLRV